MKGSELNWTVLILNQSVEEELDALPVAMKKARDLHKTWMKNPKYQAEYSALGEEFDLAATLIAARSDAGLSQQQVAERMKTSQSFVARLEAGIVAPTWKSLRRYAQATGTRLRIELERETV